MAFRGRRGGRQGRGRALPDAAATEQVGRLTHGQALPEAAGWKSGRPGAGASGRRFSIGVSGLYACELEVDGEGVPHVHRLAVHFAGDEFGETLNHTHCFFVEIGVFSAEDFHFAD